MRDNRIVQSAVTAPTDFVSQTRNTVGWYSFFGVEPGEYQLVFEYGRYTVSRETIRIDGNRFASWTTHLLLSKYPQIPICV